MYLFKANEGILLLGGPIDSALFSNHGKDMEISFTVGKWNICTHSRYYAFISKTLLSHWLSSSLTFSKQILYFLLFLIAAPTQNSFMAILTSLVMRILLVEVSFIAWGAIVGFSFRASIFLPVTKSKTI